jgi:hypothetical protein
MKIHMWRFAHDCLPNGEQLVHHQILATDSCVFCRKEEGIKHALLTCQFPCLFGGKSKKK